MRATITKIDHRRKGTDELFYATVYFRIDGGGSAKTHLCKSMRNFKRWEKLLKIGATIDNLTFKHYRLIDADCHPIRVPTLNQPNLLDDWKLPPDSFEKWKQTKSQRK